MSATIDRVMKRACPICEAPPGKPCLGMALPRSLRTALVPGRVHVERIGAVVTALGEKHQRMGRTTWLGQKDRSMEDKITPGRAAYEEWQRIHENAVAWDKLSAKTKSVWEQVAQAARKA